MSLERMGSARMLFNIDQAGSAGGGDQGASEVNLSPEHSQIDVEAGSGTLSGEVQAAKPKRRQKLNTGESDYSGLNAFMNGYDRRNE